MTRFFYCCLWCLSVQAQTTLPLFNRTFCSDTVSTITPAVQVLSDGYLLFGNYTDDYANEHIYMRKLDLNGYPQWLRVIDDEWDENQNIDAELGIIAYGRQVITTTDNHIVLAYSKDTLSLTGTTRNVYLTKLDMNGERIWQHNYGISNRDEICRHVIQTLDGGFMLVGTQGALNNEPGASFYVIKTDASGIMEWDTTYVGNWGQALTVQQTPWDNGYIIGGFALTDTTNYDMWVIKIGAAGELEWQRNFDGYQWADCGARISILTTLEEYQNNLPIRYLLFGCKNVSFTEDSDAYIAVLDELGYVIWSREDYDTLLQGFLSFEVSPIIKQDKSFVAIVATSSPRPDNRLVHFSAIGDILSTQLITIDTLPTAPHYDLYLKDIKPTPDGGYVFAGYQFAPSPVKSWIVKTDSLGNTVPVEDCESVDTAIDTVLPNALLPAFVIHPNPATVDFRVEWRVGDIPESVLLYVYDLNGKIVAQSHHSATVSVCHLPRGIYYIKIDGFNQVQKLAIF